MNQNEIPEGGIFSLTELDNCEVVRGEFLSPTFLPKITLRYESFSFSSSCVRLFPDAQYVQILTDRNKKRIIILPSNPLVKEALKWSTLKNEKSYSRSCLARILCAKLYSLMNWIPENRYRVLAVYQEIENVRLIVFNLEECEMLVPETITTDDGKTVRKQKKILPDAWRETFGMTYKEHKDAYNVDINAHYILSDNKTGMDAEVGISYGREIVGREASAVEIITRPYGGFSPEPTEE